MSLEDNLYPLLKLYEAAPQPVKTLAGRVYRAIPASLRYGPSYAGFQAEARAVETWDAATIRDFQTRKVQESLMAAARAPFYAARFAEQGVEPAKFTSLEQLAEYPLLTKSDLIVHREQMVNSTMASSQRLYLTTGGSSGVPVGFYLHKGVSRAKEQAYLNAMWSRVGYVPGAKVAVIRGHAVGGRKPWYFDATRNWLIMSSAMLSVDACDDYLEELRRFRPQFIHAYPSSAMLLAQHMADRSIKLDGALSGMLCGSEHLSLEDKAWLERVFQTKVFRWYGHSERTVLAGEGSRSSAFHFCPAYGYVEFGAPDAEGLCEVIGTSFDNQVMPLIRYRTGDFVRMAPVGSPREFDWPCVTEIVGRESEFLVARDGRRVPVTVVNRHDDAFDGLRALQFHQSEAGSLEVRVVPSATLEQSALTSIEQRIVERIGSGFTLRICEVEDVERTARGKQRWLVSSLPAGGGR
jgi:phenylacetate-CoA ligase